VDGSLMKDFCLLILHQEKIPQAPSLSQNLNLNEESTLKGYLYRWVNGPLKFSY